MIVVLARLTRRAQRQDQFRSIVGELVDHMSVRVHDPHVLFRIVGADLHVMRPVPEIVPLRPFLDDVAFGIHDEDAVLPPPVDARPTHTFRLQLVPIRDGVAGLPQRQAKVGELQTGSELR